MNVNAQKIDAHDAGNFNIDEQSKSLSYPYQHETIMTPEFPPIIVSRQEVQHSLAVVSAADQQEPPAAELEINSYEEVSEEESDEEYDAVMASLLVTDNNHLMSQQEQEADRRLLKEVMQLSKQ